MEEERTCRETDLLTDRRSLSVIPSTLIFPYLCPPSPHLLQHLWLVNCSFLWPRKRMQLSRRLCYPRKCQHVHLSCYLWFSFQKTCLQTQRWQRKEKSGSCWAWRAVARYKQVVQFHEIFVLLGHALYLIFILYILYILYLGVDNLNGKSSR